PYNLTPTLQVGVIAPFLAKNMHSNTSDDSQSGLGDATVFVKKLVVQVDRRGETFRVAVKGSAKLPTGDDDGPLPLGTGSLDYGLSAVAGWIKSRWGLYGEAIYRINTSNDGVDFGDRFGYNAAVGYRLLPTHYTHYPQPQFNLFIELNGSVTRRSNVNGIENPDSGGSILFLSPGVQYVGGRRWLIEASVQAPVFDGPNGVQLGTGWTASLGTRILLF
ncbi:MAG: transporter, partial [Phycisphaerae bacterium]